MTTDVEEKKYRRRNKEPLAYCKWMVDKPRLWFGLTLSGHILLMCINFFLIPTTYEILPAEFNAFPMDIKKNLIHQRENAWYLRDEDPQKVVRFTIDDIGPTWSRGYRIDVVTLYYTAGGASKNVFQQKYFTQMEEIEAEIFAVEEYRKGFCQLEQDQTCKLPLSVIRYFDGTYRNISDVFYDPNFQNIPGVLYEASVNPETSEDFRYFLGEGYILTPSEAFSNVTRSGFPLGWPLPGPGNDTDKYEIVEDFVEEYFLPVLKDVEDRPTDGLELNYFSAVLFSIDILPQTFKDMMLAIGSLFFILIFIWIQTGSFWITGWAIFSIITCFWITNLIYRTIINYAYFGFFHIIAIFIILGIGADDIFVFFNTWKATAVDEYKSLAHRLSDTYRRAAGTMFYTSFTTMMAFLVGGISPILPLGSFGIFTGVLVGVNYISVIVFFPNVILTHHLYFEKPCCVGCCRSRCCVCCSKDNPEPTNACAMDNKVEDGDIAPVNNVTGTPKKKKKHVIVRFFAGPYYRFVTHKVIRWIILIVFTAFLGFFIWSATRIEPSAEEVMIYRETTNYGKAMRLAANAFIPSGENFVVMYLVWGLQPTDFSDCHYTDWECDGVRTYDDLYDMNTPAAQSALVDFCQKLKHNLTSEEVEELRIQNNSVTGELEVDCLMDNMQVYLQKQEDSIEAVYNTSLDLSYPLSMDNMEQYMGHKPNIYQPGTLGRQFYRYFEIGISSWLSDDYRMLTTDDFIHYDGLVGEAFDPPFTQPVKINTNLTNGTGPWGFYGTRLRYAAVRVNLTLPASGLGYVSGLPVMERWETFFQQQLELMPAPMQGGFPVTDFVWHWLVIQETLERGAWFGITIGVCIACVVLVIATLNIIVGLQASILIGGVIAGVLGVIPLAGWKIDVMISMNLTLLVGLSVDYIVHIAEGYHLSEATNRQDRIRDMLENLGISILNGAATTMGAAFFMLFAKITFFFQFGTFLFCIIGFSMAFSLIFFPAMMSLIGPEGDTGSIVTPFKKLHYKVIGRVKDDVTCTSCHGKGFGKQETKNENNTPLMKKMNGTVNQKEKYTLEGTDNFSYTQTAEVKHPSLAEKEQSLNCDDGAQSDFVGDLETTEAVAYL